MSWGVRPQAMIGHSLGEYVAACLAGVFSLKDALALVSLRGWLVASITTGAMVAAEVSEDQALALAQACPGIDVAAVNGPTFCVLSGSLESTGAVERLLADCGLKHRRLHLGHAFHSAAMEPVLPRFHKGVASVDLSPPAIPCVSNLSGTWMTPEEAVDPSYWTRHLRGTVRFSAGVSQLLDAPARVLLEVGPGLALSTLVRQHQLHADTLVVPCMPKREQASDVASLVRAAGELWLAGVPVDPSEFFAGEQRRRVPLPGYPFERGRYWLGSAAEPTEERAARDTPVPSHSLHRRPQLSSEYVRPGDELEEAIAAIWRELLGFEEVGVHDNFFELGGHSLLATQLVNRLLDTFPIDVELERIFELQTVAKQAQAIRELLMSRLEEISEEEADRLLSTVQLTAGNQR
jgi:phthiocerol/phenolphthiocerol synthesis type-I polyketide synthase E